MAFSYNKKNLANTTITGAITSSDTSITVDDATVFPSGYFYATLMPSSEMSTFSNSEIVLVTNISSNTLTIARGQKNTTARAFSAGAIITNGIYTEDLDFAQSVGKKIFSATWGGQESPYYKITDDMLKVVPDEGTSIRAIFDTDYASGTARLSINESTSGVATVSGSNISITDAENLAPVDVKFKGDTFQQTYSGINTAFLNQSLNTNYSSSNWTYTSDTGEDVTATKVSGGGKFFATFEANVVSGHTYRIKATVGASSGTIQIYLYKDQTWGTSAGGRVYIGTGNVDVQITPDYTGKMVLGVFSDGSVNDTIYCKDFMFGENVQSSSSYEPYVGGTASPSPDYPQTIQTVTGEQTVTISDGGSDSEEFKINLGKNLWVDTTSLGQGGWNFSNGNWFNDEKYVGSEYVSVQPNTTYTLSASKGVTGEGTAGGGVIYYNGSTYLGYTIKPTGGSFTTPSNCNRIKYNFYNTNGLTVSEVTNIQLEKGSTATSYAPYFAPIELCKLGTYQDYIYKDNGDWYIHKETATYTFTGSENCNIHNNGVNARFGDNGSPRAGSMANDGIEPIMIAPDETIVYPIYSSVASADTIQHVWFGHKNKICYGSASYGAISISFGGTALTKEQYLEKLAGTKIAYIRRTPTDTQITDSTLISQLNALSEVTLNAGTNNIVVTGGLDGILEVQYYRAGSGVNLVPIVNGAYVADDNTRNVAPVKAGIPYDLTYHSGNWYVMNMVKQITADDIDFTTYSTEEQVVGTWIDGKPIYRKVLAGTASATNIGVPVGENNISKFIFIDAYRFTAGAISDTIGQFYSNTNDFFKFWGRESSNHNFSIELRNSTANYDYTIIVEYTKTTDTAQQTRSVTDSETDNEAVEEEPIEEPVEEQQNR